MRIGERTIGPGAPPYVIAEAGVNHDGSLDRALALVDAAADAGADAVKFQTFDPAALAAAGAPLAEYQHRGAGGASDQLAMLSRLALGADDFRVIAARCADRSIEFLSTPFDDAGAGLLVDLGVRALKIGSGELTNTPFLERLAHLGLPMLVSTGMGDIAEIDAAVAAIGAGGGPPLALLHCVSSYPTPPEQANLRAIATLQERYGPLVGYSDHCLGLDVSLAAVALGAVVLERHLTLDRDAPGPDHAMSLLPGELADLVERSQVVWSALGTGAKEPQPAEAGTRAVVRRSLVAVRDLRAGETITAADVAAKRPGGGLPPDRLDALVGATVVRDIAADTPFTKSDLGEAGS